MSLLPSDATDLSELTIIVGSRPACVQCNATYRALDRKLVPYESKDLSLDENANLLDLARELGYMEAPIGFVFKDGTLIDHWSGFRPDKINVYAALVRGEGEAAA